VSSLLARITGRVGRLTLNRPRALNALTADMVVAMDEALVRWSDADRIRQVLIHGAGERGLCAGGDIRAIHADAVAGGSASLRFWRDEYRLNARIASYPKPIVAWMDGLVMGGGVGVSGHASIRVVTERTALAMPEVGIGLHPDVGGSWLLAHCPGEWGTHLALTGGTITGADAIHAGLADFYLPSAALPRVAAELTVRDAAAVIEMLATTPPASELATAQRWIDECYRGDDVGTIVDQLKAHPDPAAQAAAATIVTKSPTSLKVTLRSLRTAKELPDLVAALEQEYRLSAALLRSPDLIEGVRAQIIDKDRNPHWSPPTLEMVSDEAVSACFAATSDNIFDLGAALR